MKWEMVRLGDIVKMVTGKTPPTSNIDYFDGGYLWVNPSDFGPKHIVETKRTISQKAVDEKKCTLLPKEAVLLSCIGDIGKIGILKTEGASNQQITGLIAKENVYSDYLYYYLMYSKAKLESLANKAVVAILNNERLRELEVILPPLAIQKRIAEVLDAADALRRKDQQLLQKYDELAQAVFVDMFGDPVRNEKGWEVKRLWEVINKERPITYGILMPGKNIKPNGVPYIRVVDIKEQAILEDQVCHTSEEIASQYKRSVLKTGDIVLSIRGHVGRSCIIPDTMDGANITQDTARLDFNSEVNNYFAFGYINCFAFSKIIKPLIRGAAVKGLNLGDLRNLPIPVPEIELQNRYERWMRLVWTQKSQVTLLSKKSNDLFNSLLHQAFNAELITP